MRNLNNYELNGRNLRVDNAANEKNRDEAERRNVQQQQQQQPQIQQQMAPGMSGMPLGSMVAQYDNPYGQECDPQEAPEVISRAVANLPPEQMFELASQMKQCIETNPNEARNMLMQNPQLAYALLQALVVMKIIDPQVASSMLHRPPTNTAPVMPAAEPAQPWAQNFGGGAPTVADPRLRPGAAPVDPRFSNQNQGMRQPPQQSSGQSNAPSVHEQQEKAQLVMQLLQLTDDQIALLTPDQQRSIRELKAQMGR